MASKDSQPQIVGNRRMASYGDRPNLIPDPDVKRHLTAAIAAPYEIPPGRRRGMVIFKDSVLPVQVFIGEIPVGNSDDSLWMTLQKGTHPIDLILNPHIILVGQEDVFPPAKRHGVVEIGDEGVPGVIHNADPFVRPGIAVDQVQGVVFRFFIGDDQFILVIETERARSGTVFTENLVGVVVVEVV